jgi:IS30 family transposase
MYKRIGIEEREIISQMRFQEKGINEIARELKRSPSSISNEINKYSVQGKYYSYLAQDDSKKQIAKRRNKKKLDKDPQLRKYVFEKIKKHWSPEQIAIMSESKISHETIYAYLYAMPRGTLKKELLECLRQKRGYRKKRTFLKEKRGVIANMELIDFRPEEVNDRKIPGHWEGDLIIGKYNRSAIGTLVERSTRMTILVPLKARDASTVRESFEREIRMIPKELLKTLTYDQGKEMSEHKKFTENTEIKVYFCHPHSPWERGTNENTNGLVRDFFPKGIDLSIISEERIKEVQELLNERPRQVLKFKTPKQAFSRLLQGVALGT